MSVCFLMDCLILNIPVTFLLKHMGNRLRHKRGTDEQKSYLE